MNQEKQPRHFAAGIFCQRQMDGNYYILGVTSENFKEAVENVKFPGGTNRNARWEIPEQTLAREFSEETGLTPTRSSLCYVDERDREHHKYFYVVLSVSGEFPLAHVKQTAESDGDQLTTQWWPVEIFSRQLFHNHREAFKLFCQVMVKHDVEFGRRHGRLAE